MTEEQAERIAKALEELAMAMTGIYNQGRSTLTALTCMKDALERAHPPAPHDKPFGVGVKR